MDDSPFAKLLAELRNVICTYVLQAPRPLQLRSPDGQRVSLDASDRVEKMLSLAATCESILHQLFFAVNTLAFYGEPPAMAQEFKSLTKVIGDQATNSLRSIFFALDPTIFVNKLYYLNEETVSALRSLQAFAPRHPDLRATIGRQFAPSLGLVELRLGSSLDSWSSTVDRLRRMPEHVHLCTRMAGVFEVWKLELDSVGGNSTMLQN